jgi:hypothetical protein
MHRADCIKPNGRIVWKAAKQEQAMWQDAIKILVTVAVVIAVSEIGKRSSLWGAVLASLPLTSLLAFIWLYADTGNAQAIAGLSQSIFWLVLASLPLFLILPHLLSSGIAFWPALGAACMVTVGAYFGLEWGLGRIVVRL